MTLQERVQAVFEGFNQTFRQYPNCHPVFCERYESFFNATQLLVESRGTFPKEAIQALTDAGFKVAGHPNGSTILVAEGNNIAVWQVGGTS